MNKKKLGLLGITFGVLVLICGIAMGLFFGHNKPLQPTVVQPISAENFEDPAAWGKNYPAQYESYLKNNEITDKPSHFEDMPYLKIMYKGTGYAEAFNHARGHTYMLQDIREIGEVRWKGHQAACNTCKSSQIPGLIEKYGDEYYQMTFHEINDQLHSPVACANCHDPETNELKISQPPFIEAMERRGIDVSKASRQEKRTLVCAQCHVTYYFTDTHKVVFPWDEGLKVEDQIRYYDKIDFTEWHHPDTGAPLIKPRHAEYEYFKGSVHESAGVSCADCHMPYMKEGNQKISSHVWGSPLDTMEQSCMTCHRESKTWLQERVHEIQTRTKRMEDRAGEVVNETIQTIKAAREIPNLDQELLKKSQRLHREGQYYIDSVMVTNGYGFHNPDQSFEDLQRGIDALQEATKLAQRAILEAGGKLPTIEPLPEQTNNFIREVGA